MNPWVHDHRAGQLAEAGDQRLVALEVAGGREVGARADGERVLARHRAQSRASSQAAAIPCDSSQAAPSRVDISSPKAITRALRRRAGLAQQRGGEGEPGELLEVGPQQRPRRRARARKPSSRCRSLDRRQRAPRAAPRRRRRAAPRAGWRCRTAPSRRRGAGAPRRPAARTSAGDRRPALGRRDAGAAELEDDPGVTGGSPGALPARTLTPWPPLPSPPSLPHRERGKNPENASTTHLFRLSPLSR